MSGLLRFRWPVKTGGRWHYLAVKEHPFYSEEQYSPSFTEGYGDYFEAIAKRIDPKTYDPREKVEKVIETLGVRPAGADTRCSGWISGLSPFPLSGGIAFVRDLQHARAG